LKITIRFYGIAYENAGIREWSFELNEGSIVEDLLWVIVKEFPELNYLIFDKGTVIEYLAISINNRDIQGLDGINTRLNEGDRVFIMPPIGGG
jgi:MoaD family protein